MKSVVAHLTGLLALLAAFGSCGGDHEVTGSGGHAGSGGGKGFEESGIDTSGCFPLTMGAPYSSWFQDGTFYLYLDSWIGAEFNVTELDMVAPQIGTFDLSTVKDQNLATCTECLTVTKYRDDGSTRTYLAEWGTLDLVEVPAMDGALSSGSFSDVILREVVVDENTHQSTPVEGGGCLIIERAEWKTAQCEVGVSCPAELECVPNYYSTSARCVARGTHAQGEPCDDQTTTTDCAAGLSCVGARCEPICTFWSPLLSCAGDSVCNPNGICIDAVEEAAQVGEPCTKGPNWFCGSEMGRAAGLCIDRGAGAFCERLCRTYRYDCAGGEVCDGLYSDSSSYGTCTPFQ